MSVEILNNGDLRIEEYEFGAFLEAFQQAVLDGCRLDLTNNERYPQKFGSHLTVTLTPPGYVAPEPEYKPVTEAEGNTQVLAPDTAPEQLEVSTGKSGRKKKGS